MCGSLAAGVGVISLPQTQRLSQGRELTASLTLSSRAALLQLTGVLRSDGWEDLDKDDEKVWGQQLVGMQIYAMGHGSGEVKSWAQNRSQSGDGKYVV